MKMAFCFLALFLIFEILGVLQITKKGRRGALNWYFFAICTIAAISNLNSAVLYYTAFQEGVGLSDSSYIYNYLDIIFSLTKILIVPSIYAFILNLSKIKLKPLKTVQNILITVNGAAFLFAIIIIYLPVDTTAFFYSRSFLIWFISSIILSLCCLIYLIYKWVRTATLKRDRTQAITITISSIIILLSLVGILALSNIFPEIEIITFIGMLIFVIICNHYANQYNSFSFNISNLAEYVYSAVKLPVLILDISGDIMLCNASSESFFKKSADELNKLKLFDLFDFENGLSSLELHKKDAVVSSCGAVCRIAGQKCQISLNYIYDKYDEMICTVVIVTDITEKEELFRQLNESHAKIEQFNRELQSEVDRQTEASMRFVPIQFLKLIGVKNIASLKLGDSVRSVITVMFFDIRFFSVHSQMMSTSETFDFVNKVFGLAGTIIQKHSGFVDKYLGDSAMILFERAGDAVRAGIEIYRTLILDETTRITNGIDGINIGIGAHTGNVMLGVIGDTEHYASTVISKHVNTASRIEGLTKQVKAGMLISADLLYEIPDNERDFDFRYLGMVNPAGSRETIGIFEILDALPGDARERRLKSREIFESAVQNFLTENYQIAAARFKEVVDSDTTDECAKIFYEKATAHVEGRDRSNVFSFNTK